MSIASEIERLENAKTNLKLALQTKGINVDENAKIDTYPELVNDIEVGIDTSDATAIASDIVENVTAYVNGQKVTGTMRIFKEGEEFGGLTAVDNKGYQINLTWTLPYDCAFKEKDEVGFQLLYPTITDAVNLTTEDILYPKWFFNMQGTATKESADVSATSEDIRAGKVAWVNGERIVGTMEV